MSKKTTSAVVSDNASGQTAS